MSALPGLIMSCDHPGCLRAVTMAPRIVIPAKWMGQPMRPLRIMTTLHCCDLHRATFDLDAYLSGKQRTRIEREGKDLRGRAFRPDFDAAAVEFVLVSTPEYRAFLQHIGVQLYVPAA